MAIDKILGNSALDQVADSVFSAVNDSVSEIKAMQKRKAAENVQIVVQALKKIESDLQDKYDGVTTVIEKRVASIKDGKDGQNGANGRDGKDGRPGRDGSVGPRGANGVDGRPGRDGTDGVSVTNAFIDFDGSLVINLSDGQSLNVGEVVAPDLAEKIKVITNGGGTSQGVLDTLTSLQNQINALVSMGSVNYVGTWNASTNTPTIVASTGDKGDYYVVSVAGSTSINGQSLWGVGDWIIFNGSVWQRVDGGSTGNFTTLNASGVVTFDNLTASQAVFTNGSDQLVSNAITGTGNVVMSASPTLTGTISAAGLTTSGTVTHNAGTANGVAFLNGSKVLTSGSALTFDGSQLDIPAGSAASPSLSTPADVNTGLYFPAADTIGLSTNGTERVRLDPSGNLGIGTSSPQAYLHIQATSGLTPQIRLGQTSAYQLQLGYNNSAEYGFLQAYAANLSTPDDIVLNPSGGNVGIGTSSPGAKLDVNGSIAGGSLNVFGTATPANGINNVATNALGLFTNSTERARITSGGAFIVGDTSVVAAGFAGVRFNGALFNGLGLNDSSATSGAGYIYFQNNGTTIGSITRVAATSAVAYNTTSDARIKHNIVDAPNASALIDGIKVRSFNWNSDNSLQRYGFIAQELVTVVPEAVHQPADTEQMMAVDYSKLVPMLVKEIQSLRQRLAAAGI